MAHAAAVNNVAQGRWKGCKKEGIFTGTVVGGGGGSRLCGGGDRRYDGDNRTTILAEKIKYFAYKFFSFRSGQLI
ncbi:MAG: hypothetical protein OXF02_02785 [Simkaniaceae bacterium]|nr:hypothetical protein [Simkaniaceae bacterium]